MITSVAKISSDLFFLFFFSFFPLYSSAALGNPSLQAVFNHLNKLSQVEAQALLRRCCIRVAEMKEKSVMDEQKLHEHEIELEQTKRQVEAMAENYEHRLDEILFKKQKVASELENLKNFLRDRSGGGSVDDEVGSGSSSSRRTEGSVDRTRMSAEDMMKRSVERQQPTILRMSRKGLRAIPRPKGMHSTPERKRLEKRRERNENEENESSVAGTAFVML